MNAKAIYGATILGAAVFAIARFFPMGVTDSSEGEGDTSATQFSTGDSSTELQAGVGTDSGETAQTQGGWIADTIDMVKKNLTWQPPASAAPYLALIASASSSYSLPANLLARVLYQESSFNPDIITGKKTSPVGALGIAQFMPATAADFGINPLDPNQAIPAAAKYLKSLYNQFGTWDKALAAYNWGQGNVAKKGLANAPTETKNYFSQILGDLGINY
ncbi:MAG TPA: lytic transglycosylase domain-containing protein [Methylophilaceae bacterium]|jgi:hypothetical protein